MRRLVVLVAVGLVGSAGMAGALARSAAAADRDCADFANQAAAQRYFLAHGGPARDPDRLDADGDGVVCESLPCPCAKRSGGGSTPSNPTGGGGVDPGSSVDLGKVTKTTGCRVDGPLPDRSCTPGARFSKATTKLVCEPGYAGERVLGPSPHRHSSGRDPCRPSAARPHARADQGRDLRGDRRRTVRPSSYHFL
jgi:hypothetical protein